MDNIGKLNKSMSFQDLKLFNNVWKTEMDQGDEKKTPANLILMIIFF